LRQELYEAEENVYTVFNLLNSDDEYDVHRYREAPVGSHIKRRVCRPNFENDATENAAKNWQLGLPSVDVSVVIQQKTSFCVKRWKH